MNAPRRGRRRWLSLLLGIGITGALAGVLAVTLGSGTRTTTALVGERAPALAGTSLTGDQVDLAAFRGHVVLVNVWASWCETCMGELPLIARVAADYSTDGVVTLGIDTRDSVAAARQLLGELGTDLPSVIDPDGRIAVDWGVSGVPESFVVAPDGTVTARAVGAADEAWMRSELSAAVTR